MSRQIEFFVVTVQGSVSGISAPSFCMEQKLDNSELIKIGSVPDLIYA